MRDLFFVAVRSDRLSIAVPKSGLGSRSVGQWVHFRPFVNHYFVTLVSCVVATVFFCDASE